jgi:mRNA-degrading endonuclease toxin of MazEF toxin-antitoxin module
MPACSAMPSSPVLRGGVYVVSDSALTMPPNDKRQIKRTRPVIVLSGPVPNQDRDWLGVLVVPTSTSPDFVTPYCVEIARGDGNMTAQTWARVPMVQPILKEDLGNHWGIVKPPTLELLEARLLDYMGML